MRRPGLAAGLLALGLAAATAARAEVSLDQVADRGDYSVHVVSWRDLPFRDVVRQEHDFSCGSAAAATLLTEHYGRSVNEAQAFISMWNNGDRPRIMKLGFSLLDVKRFFAAQGLRSDGYRLTLQQLQARRLPAITLIQIGGYRHFVVFDGMRDDHVLIADPALGRRTMTVEDFQKAWNGIAFVVHDGPEPVDFNQDTDWQIRPAAPLRASLPDQSLFSIYRALPPVYQVAQVFNLK